MTCLLAASDLLGYWCAALHAITTGTVAPACLDTVIGYVVVAVPTLLAALVRFYVYMS